MTKRRNPESKKTGWGRESAKLGAGRWGEKERSERGRVGYKDPSTWKPRKGRKGWDGRSDLLFSYVLYNVSPSTLAIM